MTEKSPDISVVIVSYNTVDLIEACISSVLASQGLSLELFVIDNASSDGSADFVRGYYPAANLITNDVNRGYGAANNQALPECTGRYVILLNPDTTVKPDSFSIMMSYMESRPGIGLAGPRVVNPDGTRQDSISARYPGHRHGGDDLGVLPGSIACVLGACQIVRGDLLKSLGGFDEDFFLYGEDQDLCLRIRKRGFEIGFILDAVIMHHGGQSERKTLPEEVVRKKVRAEYLFYRKHYRPDTIRRIRKGQYFRAIWRIFSIRLLLMFIANKQIAQGKLAKYRVIRDETKSENRGTDK